MNYQEGQVIYYTGDNMNQDGWFIITGSNTDKWGTDYSMKEIESEYSEGRNKTHITSNSITNNYEDHKGTRFVTEESYNEYMNKKRELRA